MTVDLFSVVKIANFQNIYVATALGYVKKYFEKLNEDEDELLLAFSS